MNLCGQPKRDGSSCGYRLAEGAECPHHGSDPSRARAFQLRGALASKMKKALPDLVIGDLTQDAGILQTLTDVMKAAAASRDVDLRLVGEIRQGLSVAVNLRQAAATRELNRTLLKLEHGERAVVLLEQLKANRTVRPLPSLPVGTGVAHGD